MPKRQPPAEPLRSQILASIAEAERRLARHPKDCKGCDDCWGWGARLHLATLRVMLRRLDQITG